MKMPVFHTDQQLANASNAIRAVNPTAAPVLSVVETFAILGREGTVKAHLEDGSQWIIDGDIVRQLTAEESTEYVEKAKVYMC